MGSRRRLWGRRRKNTSAGGHGATAGGYGGLWAKPPAAGQVFVIFLEKQAILMQLDHISHVFRAT